MLFWYIVLGVSILGVILIPLFRMLRPKVVSHEEDAQTKKRLKESLNSVKNMAYNIMRSSGNMARKNLLTVYNKGLSTLQNTQIGDLVRGRGILKKKDVTSSFLRDVKEHRDKVREELKNGNDNLER